MKYSYNGRPSELVPPLPSTETSFRRSRSQSSLSLVAGPLARRLSSKTRSIDIRLSPYRSTARPHPPFRPEKSHHRSSFNLPSAAMPPLPVLSFGGVEPLPAGSVPTFAVQQPQPSSGGGKSNGKAPKSDEDLDPARLSLQSVAKVVGKAKRVAVVCGELILRAVALAVPR